MKNINFKTVFIFLFVSISNLESAEINSEFHVLDFGRLNTVQNVNVTASKIDIHDYSLDVKKCHELCEMALEKLMFKITPNTTDVIYNTKLELECSLTIPANSSARFLWLFQGVNPPKTQCSLLPEDTLRSCNEFLYTDFTVDENVTTGLVTQNLILKELNYRNSGFFMCMEFGGGSAGSHSSESSFSPMIKTSGSKHPTNSSASEKHIIRAVELSCCDSHIMDQTLRTNSPIRIGRRSYYMEMSVVVICILIFVAGMPLAIWYQYRRKEYSILVNTIHS